MYLEETHAINDRNIIAERKERCVTKLINGIYFSLSHSDDETCEISDTMINDLATDLGISEERMWSFMDFESTFDRTYGHDPDYNDVISVKTALALIHVTELSAKALGFIEEPDIDKTEPIIYQEAGSLAPSPEFHIWADKMGLNTMDLYIRINNNARERYEAFYDMRITDFLECCLRTGTNIQALFDFKLYGVCKHLYFSA